MLINIQKLLIYFQNFFIFINIYVIKLQYNVYTNNFEIGNRRNKLSKLYDRFDINFSLL